MVRRPYLASSVIELEEMFEEKKNNAAVLAALIVELAHRGVPRAKKLERKVLQEIAVKRGSPPRSNAAVVSEGLLSVEEHRRVSVHLRAKQKEWSPEEQKVALLYADHHEFLANLIDQRSAGK